MRMIVAYLRPDRLEDVARALAHIPRFPGLTVTESAGFGSGKTATPTDRRTELTDFTPTARVEVVVSNAHVETVVATIMSSAQTGRPDDGKVFVLPVDSGMSIRTGEREGE